MKTTRMLAILVLALSLTAQVANADFTFGTPTNLTPLAGSGTIWGGRISPDGLSLYFGSTRAGGYGYYDIWVVTRETTDDDWGSAVNLGPTVNTPYSEYPCDISADGLSLYIGEHGYNRPGGYGMDDMWVATRETTDNDWGAPVNLGPTVNSAHSEVIGVISTDGLSLYLQSNRPGTSGGDDMWVATREITDDEWGEPVNLGSTVNSSSSALEGPGSISTGGLTLFFDSSRPGGYGGYDVWMVTRPTTYDPWDTPVNLGPTINTSAHDWWPSISRDDSTLYFLRRGSGMWQVPIIPIVDLNGDGIVDSADMCIMVEHWGTDESLYDIGPTPLGDGIVDVQDLIVLSEYLFKELKDLTLVAHWALDETEGDIASDSANDNDCTVYGDPAWHPEGGIVYGSLQLDGIDDYISTPFVLNPTDGKFSVFVWIKGGAPGQAVVSQMGGARWLCADPSEGNLMTELKASGRGSAELLSQTVITDGNWHRIGLVWDGSNRTLYVDDIAVTEDTQTNLEGSYNGLYIGTGKAMEPGSFWSGLIDDVRIYNRAVTP